MATASEQQRSSASSSAPLVPLTGGGRPSEHLKQVPPSKALRERIRAAAVELAEGLNKSRPLARHEMEGQAQGLLDSLNLPQAYLGWTMVALGSAFWHEQVAAVPFDRRLLLLPHCLRDEDACPAETTEAGLLCEDCGCCRLTELRADARRLGYKVMIAEGSPTVMKIILGGYVDAILGVACLDTLEKTLDKVLISGIPAMAVPLLSCGCRETSADEDWIGQLIATPHRPASAQTRTYLHLMRCAAQMFEPDELDRLVPRVRDSGRLAESNGEGLDAVEPIACTEAIAYDFLLSGGKHSRPFITLAVYDALTGGGGTLADGASHVAGFCDAARRTALAIEIFHKASLVHDDVEDDDSHRYGRPAVHRRWGVPAAVNVGDYLIGLGYRLVAAQRDALGADVAAQLLAQFASAHTRLCEGQGAELMWRDARDKRLAPLDALKIYALKTAPAFEAAILAGIRLAGPAEPYRDVTAKFARHLGVAYQILNDLDDWQDGSPRRQRGGDLLAGRPTVLWALAMQRLDEQQRQELESLADGADDEQQRILRAAELYDRADVCQQATALVAKHHQRARAAADGIDSEPLRELLHFLCDAILDRRPLSVSEEKSEIADSGAGS